MRRTFLAVVSLMTAAVAVGRADEPKSNPSDPPKVEAKADDGPEVKKAKEVMAAVVEVFTLREQQLAGGAAALDLNAQQFLALADLTAAADDAFPDPKDRLPWYEYRAGLLARVEKGVAAQVEAGTASPVVAALHKVERAKAELALLKLKKQIKR